MDKYDLENRNVMVYVMLLSYISIQRNMKTMGITCTSIQRITHKKLIF